jgi:DNA-binding Lrp family transcriptional regulator
MVDAYVLIAVSPGSEKRVSKLLSLMRGVVEVSELYGEYDIIIKARKDSLPELDTFLTDQIRSVSDVKLTSTMLVSFVHKKSKAAKD